MITNDDITDIMTRLGCRLLCKPPICESLYFEDPVGEIVTVRQEGDLFRIERWSREHEAQLTDERDFRRAAEAVLWQ